MYTMPTLPYPTDALVPVIGSSTIGCHYGKHLQTYMDNLNALVKDTEYEGMKVEDIVKNAPEGPLLNNAGQVLNHTLYFEQFFPMRPVPNEPKATLMEAIENSFGGFSEMQVAMNEASLKLFGSGWVWLSAQENGRLVIVSEPNGGNPVRRGLKPLLGIDVWEHAYYLDYQNRRGEHVKRLWEIINWTVIEKRL